MESMDGEVLFICTLWVVAVRHIDDVLFDVFLDDKPRTTTQSQTLALAYGVKPVTFVLTYLLACFQFNHVTRPFAKIAADIVIIV